MAERLDKPHLFRAVCAGAGLLAFLAAVIWILSLYDPDTSRFFPPCPFYALLHLYCPGCGATRAAVCLVHGDLIGVWRNNPFLVPTLAFAVLLYFLPRMRKPPLVWGYVVLLVLFWVLRNLPWHPFVLLAPPVPGS